jgi:hypothetical protein
MRRAALVSAVSAVALAVGFVGVAATAMAGDTPAGFYYGTDTNGFGPTGPGPSGSSVPYKNPSPCDGDFGSYVGRIESFPDSDNHEAWSNDANKNANSGDGVGSQNYYVLSGPDGLSGFNGTASEATTWGEDQGEAAINNFYDFYNQGGVNPPSVAIIYADLETGGGGWTSNKSLNRDVFNGFWDVVHEVAISVGNSAVLVFAGVYATADFWNDNISGTLNGTLEWTAQTSLSAPPPCASGFSTSSTVAHFYASYTSSSTCAVAWQWISSPAEDWDQVDAARMSSDVSNVSCN